MIGNKRILGLIPARGGSKGIPRKNVRLLGGKPLIAWTIDEAKKSKYIDRLVVSTDDHEIAEIARKYGADVPFMRPAELATDTARGVDVVLHALHKLPEYDAVILLQPTSPFRTTADIDGAIEHWAAFGRSVVGITEAPKSPYWMYQLRGDGSLKELLQQPPNAANRQELPRAYVLNGAIYVGGREELMRNGGFLTSVSQGFLMANEHSIDVDTEIDWDLIALIASRAP